MIDDEHTFEIDLKMSVNKSHYYILVTSTKIIQYCKFRFHQPYILQSQEMKDMRLLFQQLTVLTLSMFAYNTLTD